VRRGPGAPTALLLIALLAASCTRPAEGSRHLGADVPRWAVAGFDLEFDVRLLGPIAERNTGVAAFVDGNRIDFFPSRDRIVRVTLPGSQLRAGTRKVRLKTGNERASAEVVVLSRGFVAAVALGPLALLAVISVALRRRRRAG